jgi:hypothetical protein
MNRGDWFSRSVQRILLRATNHGLKVAIVTALRHPDARSRGIHARVKLLAGLCVVDAGELRELFGSRSGEASCRHSVQNLSK